MEYWKKFGVMRYTLLTLSMTLYGSVYSQIPSVNEPFPGDHGPEPTTATSGIYNGCPVVCAQKLESAMNLIQDLQRQVETLNSTMSTRLNGLSSESGQFVAVDLQTRVSNLETYLYGNVTEVTAKLNTELATTSTTLRQEMSTVRLYVDDQFAKLSTNTEGGSGTTEAMDVYRNITARIDLVENVKMQTLIDENNVWRKNFEVVNRTFAKLRKSRYSNDVIVVG